MARSASPYLEHLHGLEHPLGGDSAAVNRQLDELLPGWRDSFGEDLPEGLDLRPAVTRMRAVLLLLQVRAAAGELSMAGMSSAQSVSTVCQWIREQLYGSELVPGLPAPRRSTDRPE
jgi:hypothetical protein